MHWKRRLARSACVALLILPSCQTASVLTSAPEEFWLTAEQIPTALVLDIISFIEWVIGLAL